jgi:branched-subunit amino acid transport protein AzlD
MDSTCILAAIMAMMAATYLTRAIPFLFFGNRQPPWCIVYLETYLSPVMMTILVFYALKDTDFSTAPYGAYELGAVAITIALHLGFKNYLVSIFGGTLAYMAMVQGWLLGFSLF